MPNYVKSPLNYMGGKYKILKYIIPNFPQDIRNFVDLFAGGLNVGINVEADNIYVNDHINFLIELYKYFSITDIEEIIKEIKSKISSYGLSSQNEQGYLRLRNDYNENRNALDLFLLVCYSFNHQIRFNNSQKFNTPFGKNRSSYNATIEENLKEFVYLLQSKNFIFSTVDFNEFDFSNFAEGDIVYCDPPYLITTGSYNDGKRGFKDWTIKEEMQLLELLDKLDKKGIYFALSNVLLHKGTSNKLLIDWSKKYFINSIDKSYSNCSYHFKERNTKTEEVLITNFKGRVEKCEQLTLGI